MADPAGIYVSSVEGNLVPRFGCLNLPGARLYIGATRKGDEIVWTPDAIVFIPDSELVRYGREYRKSIAQGALKVRTAQEYNAQLKRADTASTAVAQPVIKPTEDQGD